MSKEKQLREILRALSHASGWFYQLADGEQRVSETMQHYLTPVADKFGHDPAEIADALVDSPFQPVIYSFAIDQTLLTPGADGSPAPLVTYLTKRGHRERPEGRRYLRLLAGSEVELWDIVDVNPGRGLIVQRAFTDEKPLLINESSGSQYLAPGQALLGRLLPMPKGRVFAPGMVPLDRRDLKVLKDYSADERVPRAFTIWAYRSLCHLQY